MVGTETLVKNGIELVASTPSQSHWALPWGHKKGAKLTLEEPEIFKQKMMKEIQKQYDERKKNAQISSFPEERFQEASSWHALLETRPE